MRVLPDGSVVAGGEGTGAANQRRLLVAKLGPTGAPAAGFGTAGVVRLLAGTGNNQGQALTLQSDGRILIAGGAVLSGNVSSFAVARLTAAGLPDTTWAPTGVATTPLGATGYATAIVAVGARLRRRGPPRRLGDGQRVHGRRRRPLRRRAVEP